MPSTRADSNPNYGSIRLRIDLWEGKVESPSLPNPLKQKHTERRANHRAGGNGNQHRRDQWSWVVAHELAVGRHDKNGNQQKRCEQTVKHSGPKLL